MRSTWRAAAGSAAVAVVALAAAAVVPSAVPRGDAASDTRPAAGEVATGGGQPVRGLATDTPAAPIRALAPYEIAKAEALLRRRLPCLGCHRLDDEGGRIGPDLTDVGARRPPEYIRAMLRDPRSTVPGTVMPAVPMPPETFELVVAYLAGRGRADARRPAGAGDAGPAPAPPAAPRPAANRPAADAPRPAPTTTRPPAPRPARREVDGAALYARYCAACHGADGGGDGPNAPYLPVRPTAHADSAYMSTRPDDSLFDAVYAGGWIMGMSHRMPAWGRTLSREQIRALVAYMRELCGCQGPAWSRDGAGGAR